MVGITLLFAVLIDQLFGEPHPYHPLSAFGKLADEVEARLNHPGSHLLVKLKGVLAVAVLLCPFYVLSSFLAHIPKLGFLFDVLTVYLAIGSHSLAAHARAVLQALKSGDLELSRERVSMIVSRDTKDLQESSIIRATIESVLENGCDSIFGAIFWFVLLGAPGVVLYRLSNTLDAMWGYRNDRYHYFGWGAARLDDVLNFVPARLTALTYAFLGNTRVSMECWKEQGKKWYSPNAGPVMAAGAGSLGVVLGGMAEYHGQPKVRPELGKGRFPDRKDIEKSIALVQDGVWLWVVVALLAGLFIHA